MKKPQVLLIIFCLASFSCSTDKQKSAIIIPVFENHVEAVSANDFIRDMRFIPLETNEENTIGSITKIVKTSDRYFILDAFSAKKLMVFDYTGKFLYNIGSTGRGPAEYSVPLDFTVDEVNNLVYILDAIHKILVFSIDGTYITEKPNPPECKYLYRIQAHNGHLFAWTNYEDGNSKKYQVVVLNENLQPAEWLLPFQKGFPIMISMLNTLYLYDGKVNYINPWENTLYEYCENSLEEKYKLDFSGNELPVTEIKTPADLLNDNVHSRLSERWVEGDSVIFTVIFDKGRPRYGFLNKKENKFMLAGGLTEESDPFYMPESYYNGYFIATSDSHLFLKQFPEKKLDSGIASNPVIIEYKICL